MKKVFLFSSFFLYSLFSNSQINCIDSSLINPQAACPFIYDPVCGCNGITYDNDCFAENLGGVTSWTQGPCSTVPSSLINFCDNFDSYNSGDPIAQISSSWNTWGELMNGVTAPFSDDAQISSVMSYSGDYSLYLNDATGQGGPQDIVLIFDTTQNIISTSTNLNTPYSTGHFSFSQMMYIVPGKTGYINFQAENIPGVQWALEVNIDANGIISLSNTSGLSSYGTCPIGSWFKLEFDIDLSNNIWQMLVDGVSQSYFSNPINQIASLDLFPAVNSEYYVDDICFTYDSTPVVLDVLNLAVSNINSISGLTGQNIYPVVEVINLGSMPINSFDIDFIYNGNTITESVTGINLNTIASYQTNFSNIISLLPGTNNCEAVIYNINGLGADDNPTDDNLASQTQAITPASGKLVIGEEATGTWCGWCPRGAVALNWMDHDFEGYWQGIAVHNGDTMTNTDYDNGIGTAISGYPSGIVDRGADINPADFKEDFLQRIVVQPKALLVNGAEITGNTLKVNVNVSFQNSINGNYKVACVIVEDSVTGVGPSYSQANAYSGGGAGPLVDVDGTDWANKPNPTPYTEMIYRHVARAIAPNFEGQMLSNTMYNQGDQETLCFEFTLDSQWDTSKIHIVSMLIDDTDRIDNGYSSTINEAVTEGYIACVSSIEGNELNGPDIINVYPNPSKENIIISNIKEELELKIYDLQGKLVLIKKVNNLSKVNLSELSKGVYNLKFKGKKLEQSRKLVIE